jgi:hypothetical protein
MLAIAMLYALKLILLNMGEVHIYKDLHKTLTSSIWAEHLLMKLENVPLGTVCVRNFFR